MGSTAEYLTSAFLLFLKNLYRQPVTRYTAIKAKSSFALGGNSQMSKQRLRILVSTIGATG